jgi:predicted phage-related endonuclease
MKQFKWQDNQVIVEPIAKNKKITGTHFPTVLGINPFSTPFETWCRCTRLYEVPFEGNKYTNAGQIIEPKVFDFLRESMGFGDRVITPEDVYGKDHFKKTWGDFFPNTKIYGGMWDCLIRSDNGKVEYVVEIKTVQVDGRSGNLDKRWKEGAAPHYQALQASLYAFLLGVDKVLMVAVALEDSKGDYEHPEQVVPSFANGNVYIDEFKISERYPNFDMYIEQATSWWNKYVVTGISPEFDEKKDAEILKALRTNNIEEKELTFNEMILKAEQLKIEIDAVQSTLVDKTKELKITLDEMKKYMANQFRDGDTKVSCKGNKFEFVLSQSVSTELDKDQLIKDLGEDLLNKYTKTKTSLRLTTSEIKED